MALKDVLSTLRVVLLDDFAALPEDSDKRKQFFRENFPKLSDEEVRDFSIIDPKQFAVYTKTIFSGQRSVLKKHFPITFFLIEKYWPNGYQQNFSAYELVKRVHASRPWRGNSTASLIESFATFLSKDNPQLLASVPYLLEIVKIEQITLELRRALEQDQTSTSEWSDICALNVSEFLSIEFCLSPTLRFVTFEFDILALYRDFHQNSSWVTDCDLLPTVALKEVHAIGVRRFDLAVRWLAVERDLFTVLQDEVDDLNALAEAVFEQLPGQSEEAKFQEFVKLVHRLVINEVILLRS